MKSCRSSWKIYFGVSLIAIVVTIVQGRPQGNTSNVETSSHQQQPQQHSLAVNGASGSHIVTAPDSNTRPRGPQVTTSPDHQYPGGGTDIWYESSAEEQDTGNRRGVRNATVTHLLVSDDAAAAGSGGSVKEKPKTLLGLYHKPSRGHIDDVHDSHQDIIFPDSFESMYPVPKFDSIPPCARGSLFCENISTYPYHQIQESLIRSKVSNDLFFDDEVDSPKEITNRISGPEEKFICKAVEKTIYPRVGMTKDNKWKFIINQEEGYIQGVRVETCVRPDRPCDLMENLPLGYSTSCRQKHVRRRMMSLAENGTPIPDVFLMPSACCCAYRVYYDWMWPRKESTVAQTRAPPPSVTPG